MNDKYLPSTECINEEAARLKAIYNARKLDNKGLNQAVLAELCDWSSQGTVSQYMTGGLPLNIEALLKLANVLQFNPAEVSPRLAQTYLPAAPVASQVNDNFGTYQASATLEPGPELSRPFRRTKIVGTAQLGPEGYWDAIATTDGWLDVPSSDPDAYSLRVRGDSMAPAIRSGWVVWCEPNHALIPGEYVMVRCNDGQCMVKELLFENTDEVSLMAVNDGYGRLTIARQDIEQIHYVGGIVPPSKIKY
ncbi:MAG: S24 family peptidase [Pseudomonas sp.]|uniref:XRE family transcriptional regulator n=1 Tax=Pseudomonas sp. TaxID=306 RepID=UPI0027367676|nr:S24 family peptidase [Pseudomonas sp.]MDP3848606.1 S24 family peptidase [Pseudomonas sp.]